MDDTLESKFKDDTISRRDFVRLGVLGSLGFGMFGCGGKGGGSNNGGCVGPSCPSGFNAVYQVVSSDGSGLGSVSIPYTPGQPLIITPGVLSQYGVGVVGFDQSFMVSRQLPVGDRLGSFESNTSNGQLRVSSPDGNLKVIYLFPDSSSTDYRGLFDSGFGYGVPVRYASVGLLRSGDSFPLSGVTVIDDFAKEFWITNGLDMLNGALAVRQSSGVVVKYSSFSWDRNNSNADLMGGLANIDSGVLPTYFGYHSGNKFVLFRNNLIIGGSSDIFPSAIATAEEIETYLRSNDMYGRGTTVSLFTPGDYSSGINQLGKNRLRFCSLFPQ
jgi:hypothetical protein